ncbi:MAG: hypothetical protein ACRCTZ_18475 [Sarcina sp.]
MKNKLIVVLALSILSVGFLGCGNENKDVILRENVTKEGNVEEDKINIEKVKGLDNLMINGLISEEDEFYAVKAYDEINLKPLNEKDTKVYKLEEDNFVEIENKGRSNSSFIGGITQGIVLLENNSGTAFENVGYLPGIEEKASILFELDEPVKIESESPIFIKTGMFNDELGFYNIFNNEGAQIFSGDPSLDKTKVLEVVNIKTKERFKVENDLKKQVILGFEYEGLNLITSDFKMYKLKKNNEKFTLEQSVDLLTSLGLKESQIAEINHIGIENDEVVICGSKISKAFSGNENTEEEMKKLIEVKDGFIGKYNLKTQRKVYIEVGNENAVGSIIKYFKGLVLLSRPINDNGEIKQEYYIGEIADDKIKILKRLNFYNANEECVRILSSVSNKSGEELLVEIIKSTGEQNADSDVREYYKIKLND